jgi:hypothetical protein
MTPGVGTVNQPERYPGVPDRSEGNGLEVPIGIQNVDRRPERPREVLQIVGSAGDKRSPGCQPGKTSLERAQKQFDAEAGLLMQRGFANQRFESGRESFRDIVREVAVFVDEPDAHRFASGSLAEKPQKLSQRASRGEPSMSQLVPPLLHESFGNTGHC